jgi:hypothetical protein
MMMIMVMMMMMIMEMMMKKENIGNPCSLTLALHVNFPNYWFGSSRIR